MRVMHRFRDGWREAFRSVFADRAAVAALFLAVIIYSFYYPLAYRHQVATRMPVVAVDLDRSPMSRLLLRKIQALQAIELAGQADSMAQARSLLERGVADGIILIDSHFQRDIERGGQGQLAFLGGGAYLGRSATVLAGLADAVAGFSREALLARARVAGRVNSRPLVVVQRPLYNTREGYASAVVSGVSVLIVQQTLLLTIVLLAATRREARGQRLQARPLALCGGMTAFWVLGMLNLFYYAGFVFWFQDFPRGANLPGLLLGGAFFCAAVVGMGAFVGSYFRVREHAIHGVLLTAMPLYFLSGLSWPREQMPEWAQWLATLVPSTAGINLIIKVHAMGSQLSEAMPELLNLAALSVAYAGLTLLRYRPFSDRADRAGPARG